jgi:hypothetical protein
VDEVADVGVMSSRCAATRRTGSAISGAKARTSFETEVTKASSSTSRSANREK